MSAPSPEFGRTPTGLPRVVVVGEILWDIFADSRRLGGAPLNFAAHARNLGHRVTLISSLGDDSLGREARERIERLDLDTGFVKVSSRFDTGTARIDSDADGEPVFSIARPAAYDAIELSTADLARLQSFNAGWLYFGSLFAATESGIATLESLLGATGDATRFLDLNLRPGMDSPELATALLRRADVVKLSEPELERVHRMTGLPRDIREFCHDAGRNFEWQAVCVTRGDRGCSMLVAGEFVEAAGVPVAVADTVGAGDAFAAAFMHGLSRRWPAARIAAYANRIGASVASSASSLPGKYIGRTET